MIRFADLPPKKQRRIFGKVRLLRSRGFGYKRIIKRIGGEYGIKLSLSTLSYWFNKDVKLIGGENYFEEKPSKGLAYLIGVLFGDASLSFNERKREYIIKLEAIDQDFVEKFSKYLARVLKKKKSYAVCQIKRGPIYTSKTLH